MKNIPQAFFQRTEKFSQRTALIRCREETLQPLTWSTMMDRVGSIALGLLELGVQKGDCAAILSENRPEWVLADLAALSVGAIDIPIYATTPPAEIEFILKDSESHIVFVSTLDQLKKIEAIRSRLPWLKKVVLFDPPPAADTPDPSVMSLSKLEAQGSSRRALYPQALEERLQAIETSDVASILYTSGTTGPPKGVMLTHGNFISNIVASSRAVSIRPHDVVLSILPLSHSFERTVGYYMALYNGMTIAYAESLETVTRDLQRIRPTIMAAVPRFYEKTYASIQENMRTAPLWKRRVFEWARRVGDAAGTFEQRRQPLPLSLDLRKRIATLLVFRKIQKRLGGRLRFFISGGAPLARTLAEFFYSCGILILEGYGLTETSPVLTVNRSDRFKFGTVGPAIEGVELQIASDGEILAKGPNIMKGYLHREAETQQALEGGWFHTGDIGSIDPEGFLTITDRKKDLIVTAGGKNVAPQNLENLFKSDPLILEAAVFGDRMPYLVCLILPNWPAVQRELEGQGIPPRSPSPTDAGVLALLWNRIVEKQKDLSSYQQVKKIAILPKPPSQEAGDLTPTLKLRRKIIGEKYKDLIASLYHV